MNKTTSGWVLFIIALGAMCGLLSSDVAKLNDWSGARSPQFVSLVMAHFGTVVLAFVGGKQIPESRIGKFTRRGDDKEE